MNRAIRIGVIGGFEPTYHSHFATNAALQDAAAKLKFPVELRWRVTRSTLFAKTIKTGGPVQAVFCGVVS